MEPFMTPDFWIAVGQIILIDILLGGDNAVVIALACRKLPPALRTQGIIWGTAGAIGLRVVLIFFALTLLAIPFLKLVGAVLLMWIGVKLLAPEDEGGHGEILASDKLWGAVKTVIVADLVMSVDNVIAIAGAAEGAGGEHKMPLVVFGLLVSIPIIVWGSQLVIRLMDRFPSIITLGGMLLGWIAGTMAVTDPAIVGLLPTQPAARPDAPPEVADLVRYAAGVAGAALVWMIGRLVGRAKPGAAAEVAAAAALAPAGRIERLLLAVDGSEGAAAALRELLALRDNLRAGAALQVHLVNVQRPVSGDVARFVGGATLEEYHRERSDLALAQARAALDAVGVAHIDHVCVGEPGATIAEVARNEGCQLILMGARGLDGPTGALPGAVARSTIEHATVPVLLVK